MQLSRRHFLQSAGAVTLGFAGLHRLLSSPAFANDAILTGNSVGFGPLRDDPAGIFRLPQGFSYQIVSRRGDMMADGLKLPGRPDGMATFPIGDGLTAVVRNHELSPRDVVNSPFGEAYELLNQVARELIYDNGQEGLACPGGTTTFIWDTKQQKLVSQHLSLAGTVRNCAGGPTPWGSWLTCEESVIRTNGEVLLDHGWVFEVPATESGLANPIPIKAMGRFNHEAVAVDPASGVVYQTEDTQDGLIYRYIPTVPGDLMKGGRLQALVIKGNPSLDMRNWLSKDGIPEHKIIAQGTTFEVEWIDLDNVEAPADDLRFRGFAAGAARFARGEGMWYGNGAVYWACTNGGPVKKGQIWRYVPSPAEGTAGEAAAPAKLELFLESKTDTILHNADNLCVAPWGDVIVCEDGSGVQNLAGVTPQGEIYLIGSGQISESELAGCCFSPDGSTLFVNIQVDGITLAITGPWRGQA